MSRIADSTTTLEDAENAGVRFYIGIQNIGLFELTAEQAGRYINNKQEVIAELQGVSVETYRAFLAINSRVCIAKNVNGTSCTGSLQRFNTPKDFEIASFTGDWSSFLCNRHKPTIATDVSKKNKAKSGFIYLVQEESKGFFKIGRAADLHNRMKTFHVKLPFKVNLHYSFMCDDYIQAEKKLHEHFGASRVDGEWFSINEHDLELIKNPAFLASKGINAFHNTSGNGGTL